MQDFRDKVGNILVATGESIGQVLKDIQANGRDSWLIPLYRVDDSLGLYLGLDDTNPELSLFHNGRPLRIPTRSAQNGEVIGFTRVPVDTITELVADYDRGGECESCGSVELILAQIPERLRTSKSPDGMPRVCFTCWTEKRMECIQHADEDAYGPFPGIPKHQQDVFAEIAAAAGMHHETFIPPALWRPPGIEMVAPEMNPALDVNDLAKLLGKSSSESSDKEDGES